MAWLTSKLGRIIAGVVLSLLLLVGTVGYLAWYNLFRDVPLVYDSLEDNFKYGSIGAENTDGVPYWIWVVLPRLFPEYLPRAGGYTSVGLIWEEGKEMPMGFTKKTIGFPRVAINCASCHITKVRTSPDQGKPTFYLGGPAQQLNGQQYQKFLFTSAKDPRFNADYILAEINKNHQFSWFENFLYRYIIIPQTKQGLIDQEKTWEWQKIRPLQGPGRVDPFNPVKFRIFHLPEDNSVGNADIPSIWNQKPRVGLALHWNGLLSSFWEVAINSAIGDGATRDTLNYDTLKRVEELMGNTPAPKYPYPTDATLATKGEKLFNQECSTCHAFGASRTGTIIPLTEIGTDTNRSDAWTQAEVDTWKKFAEGYPFNFDTMIRKDGYVSPPLDGIWLRAPYLHNGSVASLTDLLEKPENRTKVFYRGYDVYNPEKVGFVTAGAEAEKVGFRYDTSIRGNSNQGHIYGTDLPADDKKALVEYLKTL